MGATNRPFELDDAVIRRMARRVYVGVSSRSTMQIPLPDKKTRFELFRILLKKQKCDLSKRDMEIILEKTNLFSGSDIKVLCKEAAMGPVDIFLSRYMQIRDVDDVMKIETSKIRPIQLKDFMEAFRVVGIVDGTDSQCTPSVNPASLKQYDTWNR